MATSEDALAVALRVDSSALLQDEDAASLFDDSVRVDVAQDLTLLLGVGRRVFTAGVQEDVEAGESDGHSVPLRVVVDADTVRLDEDERVADVKWLDRELFAVGFTSGVVRLFSRAGSLLFEQKLHGAAVRKLDVNRNAATMVAPRRTSVLLGTEPDSEGELWVLYADATVAIVQLSEILGKVNSAVFGPAQAGKFRKYSLRDQKDIVAAVPCGSVRPTIFQSHARLGVYTIVSAGQAPFLAFYQAGNDQNSIIHLAHIATAIASRAAGAVWNFATSWGWGRGTGEPAAGEGLGEGQPGYMQLGAGAIDAAAEHVPAPVGTTRSIYEDERRRCRVLVLSPTGRLAAVADTLGRILLVDTSRMIVIRMWKGYRNAQCGWMQGTEGARRPPGLYLVIYSAQRGIVEVWRARYGPRVFSFAVGNSAKLFTQFDPATRRTKCIVLSKTSETLSEVIELKPGLPNASILLKYFTQNKLQEENFLLHQVIGGLQAFVKKKRVDATHTLEQDALDPLLEDIGSLSSSTTIQALLDVLLNADMALLNANFLLKALDKLQLALKNGMSSRTPTGAELSLQWKLLWQHRRVSTFIGFQIEFERGKRALIAMVQTSTRDIVSRSSVNEKQTGPLPRILPWLELFRRAGIALDDESRARTQRAIDSASQLTAWEFMEFFSMPFNDPDLPRRHDILSLFEITDTKEEFLREAFRVLKTPIFRKFSTAAQRDCLFTFILAPVLSSVFAVQELQQLHSAIFLSEEILTRLFIEWFFSLPLVKAMSVSRALTTAAYRYGQDGVESEYDDETSDADAESDEDDDDDTVPRITAFKMESLTQPVKWRCRVKDLHLVFRKRWPPSHDTSALMQSLESFKFDMISVTQIADHISLIMLLDSFAATAVTPISIVKLFSNSGRYLCRSDSFLTTQPPTQPSKEEVNSINRDRTRFLKELLRHDEALGFALAEAFGLPLEVIREEYVLFLYQSGRDERADLAIEKMQKPERLILKLGAIARARLSLILRRMKTEAEYAVVMSMLPADVFAWVISDTQPPLVADPLVEKVDLTPSLTSTHYLLLRCLALIPPIGEEFEKVSAMSVLVKDVISQVKLHS
ncbi:hypothetical protein PF010_g17719 [Phytophthora fragariae]|uniref:Rab3-GAP regulatory subunit N-terminal domain-containing protein n=1 Tax=Phytophthora fragariae TaxID=53985 RepID=A0A6G0KMV6_9STRA|nr:hypothetical protein PF010_g17719 [Phytophthora fragariae]